MHMQVVKCELLVVAGDYTYERQQRLRVDQAVKDKTAVCAATAS